MLHPVPPSERDLLVRKEPVRAGRLGHGRDADGNVPSEAVGNPQQRVSTLRDRHQRDLFHELWKAVRVQARALRLFPVEPA
jgi:hypothetical protein